MWWVLGATSRVGSHLIEHPPVPGPLHAVGRTDPRATGGVVSAFTRCDLSDETGVRRLSLRWRPGDVVVNFAAATDPDACERERPIPEGLPSPDRLAGIPSWRLNALLPGWLAEEATRTQAYLIQISTNFVFDGTRGPYGESDGPSPYGVALSWYGFTKGQGEAAALSDGRHAVLRIAHPFRSSLSGKPDLARIFLQRELRGDLFPLFTDQQITPTWIPDVTRCIGLLSQQRLPGRFHVASPEVTTPFEFARTLFKETGLASDDLPVARLSESARSIYRAPRPMNAPLSISRVRGLGLEPLNYRSSIRAFASELRTLAGPEWRSRLGSAPDT
jgi:dTDP-4-dehydrorhamnose reductase